MADNTKILCQECARTLTPMHQNNRTESVNWYCYGCKAHLTGDRDNPVFRTHLQWEQWINAGEPMCSDYFETGFYTANTIDGVTFCWDELPEGFEESDIIDPKDFFEDLATLDENKVIVTRIARNDRDLWERLLFNYKVTYGMV